MSLTIQLTIGHLHQQGRIGATHKQNGTYNAQVMLLEMQYLPILSKLCAELQYVGRCAKFPSWLSPALAHGCGWTEAVCYNKNGNFC